MIHNLDSKKHTNQDDVDPNSNQLDSQVKETDNNEGEYAEVDMEKVLISSFIDFKNLEKVNHALKEEVGLLKI